MKFSILAAITALLSALTAACADYSYCRCQSADGKIFHDADTENICGNQDGRMHFINGHNYCENPVSSAFDGSSFIPFSNCWFEKKCNEHTAGSTSNCFDKF